MSENNPSYGHEKALPFVAVVFSDNESRERKTPVTGTGRSGDGTEGRVVGGDVRVGYGGDGWWKLDVMEMGGEGTES